MIKWLIPKDNARDLIGRRGAGLDEIMNASGAKVNMVLSVSLPTYLCDCFIDC